MSEPGDYGLLVLERLVRRCASLAAVRQALAAYPEDALREGALIADLQAFVADFADLQALAAAVQQRIERRGGREALEGMQRGMDFDEFLYGPDP